MPPLTPRPHLPRCAPVLRDGVLYCLEHGNGAKLLDACRDEMAEALRREGDER